MSEPRGFLIGLGRAISAMHLYRDGHPAREQAVVEGLQSLNALSRDHPAPCITILGDVVSCDGRLVHGMQNWSAGARLAGAGIQRMEFTLPVPRPEFDAFLDAALAAMEGRPGPLPASHPRIRFGAATLAQDIEPEGPELEKPDADTDALLAAEFDAIGNVLRQAAEGNRLNGVEVETIVSSLLLTVLSADSFLPQLLRLKDYDQYTAAHSLNVAVLSMSLADFSGYDRAQVRAIGVAGVLHDIGKVRTPQGILTKTGALTPEERRIINEHPRDGARIILESGDPDVELAAIVAYEHHIWYNGNGYPEVRPSRQCHPASNLLHVCDVYDALATDRPYRPAWPEPRILDLIERNSGTEFDPAPASTFLRMIRKRAERASIGARPGSRVA